MYRKFCLVSGIIFAVIHSLNGQGKTDNKATLIFNLIYNQQFDLAEQMLRSEKSNPGNMYSDVLLIDLVWWKYITDKKTESLADFLRLANENKNIATKTQTGNIKKLVGLNYLMRFELKQGNLLKAGILHLKIKNLLRQTPVENDLPGQLKLYRLYQNLFFYFEKKYIPFSSNPEGISKQRALFQLEEFCNDEDWIISSLSNYFLGKIYLEVEKNPTKAAGYFKLLIARFPANRIFTELLQDCHVS